jgi:hypothetical protein
MRKLMLLCASLCAMAFAVSAGPVQAQTLAWVSASGNNTNSCTEASPCATFAGAIANVAGVTQINCLGSGNYGATVTITTSLIIDCGAGNVGEMTSIGTTPSININTSSAATIVLRHLSLNGGDTTNSYGINTQNFAGGTLVIEDCMIHGYHPSGFAGGVGIYFAPSSGGRGTLQVSNSLIYDNNVAIGVSPASGQIASVALDGDELTGNADGLFLQGSGIVAGTMRDNLVVGNGDGVGANSSQVYFTVEESSIIDNLSIGVVTNSSGAIVNVGNSTIGGNGTGVQAQAGSIVSFGNNQMSANGANGTFTSTTSLQ